MSELAAKLARRRQLNGEGSSPEAALPPAPVVSNSAPWRESAPPTVQPQPQAPKSVVSPVVARPGVDAMSAPKPAPSQALQGTPSTSINIFSLASKENKTVMGHLKNEPSCAPIHMPNLHHIHHAPSVPSSSIVSTAVQAPIVYPAPDPAVAVVTLEPPSEAPYSDTNPIMAVEMSDTVVAAEPEILAPAVPDVPILEKATGAVHDMTDLDDLAGFEGFLDSLDEANFVRKTLLPAEGGSLRRGSNGILNDINGGIFADDEEMGVGLSAASSEGFALTGEHDSSVGMDDEDDDIQNSLNSQYNGSNKQKIRSRFGGNSLLSSFGFGEKEVKIFLDLCPTPLFDVNMYIFVPVS